MAMTTHTAVVINQVTGEPVARQTLELEEDATNRDVLATLYRSGRDASGIELAINGEVVTNLDDPAPEQVNRVNIAPQSDKVGGSTIG